MVILSYPLALVLLTILAVPYGGELSRAALLWGLLAGVGQAFGVWWFYAALGSGPISVVSPLTSVLVAAVPVGFGVALGERPSALALVGVAVALIAVVMVSRQAEDLDGDPNPHRFTVKVAWLTVGSGIAFGMNFVILDQVPPSAGLWPLVFGRMAATTIVIIAALLTANFVLVRGTPLRLAVLAGVLDTVANVATLLALHSSLLSLTGVLVALYPAATVALAVAVLRESVTRSQVVGMILAFASVALIAAG